MGKVHWTELNVVSHIEGHCPTMLEKVYALRCWIRYQDSLMFDIYLPGSLSKLVCARDVDWTGLDEWTPTEVAMQSEAGNG